MFKIGARPPVLLGGVMLQRQITVGQWNQSSHMACRNATPRMELKHVNTWRTTFQFYLGMERRPRNSSPTFI